MRRLLPLRLFPLMLLPLMLAGCATAPTTTAPVTPGLAPRNVATEACALYVWTAGPERTFTYFADSAQSALWEGIEFDLGAPEAPLSPTQDLTLDYEDETYTWKLELRAPEAFAGGTKYTSGLLRSSNQGFERVLPVVGLATC